MAHQTPALTVDIIIELEGTAADPEILLIQRKHPPTGWAIPGGFVEYGEAVELAAIREAKEETDLEVRLKRLLGVYSDPARDPRGHTVSIVYVASGEGVPKAQDDALDVGLFRRSSLPDELAFDHVTILSDYFASVDSMQ